MPVSENEKKNKAKLQLLSLTKGAEKGAEARRNY